MADLSVLARLDRTELAELVSVLAHRIGHLPDDDVAFARFNAATRRAERAMAAADAVLADYTRTKELHEKAIAEGRRSTLRGDLSRLSAAYTVAVDRSRKALTRVGRLRMEVGR